MKRTVLAVIAAAGVLAGAACSGSSNQAGPPHSNPIAPASEQVSFVVKIPAGTGSSSSSRRPEFVDTATKSVSFEVSTDGGNTWGPAQVVAIDITNETQCPESDDYYNCSAYFSAPIGSIVLLVQTYASTDGTGNVLSQATVDFTVVEGVDNSIPVTLDGVVSTLTLSLSPSSVVGGTSGMVTATWGGKDAAGNTIVVPPGNLVDASGDAITPSLAITPSGEDFTTPSYTAASYDWTTTYNGDLISNPQTFTASASGYSDATATLAFTAGPTLAVSPTVIGFLDLTPTTATVSESGYGSGTFTATSDTPSVATVTASAPATAGSATITITPVGAGFATIKVFDSFLQEADISVSVTLTHGVIQ